MSDATLESIVGTWGQCILLSIRCAELGLLEDPVSVSRRRAIAQLALEQPIRVPDLYELLQMQRAYMRQKVADATGVPWNEVRL